MTLRRILKLARSRRSVKGTKCGSSETFGTFLQQLFRLGIIEDPVRQAKEQNSMPPTPVSHVSPDYKWKSILKRRNDRAMEMIAESIKATIDNVKVI